MWYSPQATSTLLKIKMGTDCWATQETFRSKW